MSLIINPNAPQLPRSHVDMIFDTMRVISQYRLSFFDLEAAKQSDGVTELSASDLVKLNDAQQRLMQDMVTFILYGDGNGQPNTNGKAPTENLKENAKKLTQETERPRNALLT